MNFFPLFMWNKEVEIIKDKNKNNVNQWRMRFSSTPTTVMLLWTKKDSILLIN